MVLVLTGLFQIPKGTPLKKHLFVKPRGPQSAQPAETQCLTRKPWLCWRANFTPLGLFFPKWVPMLASLLAPWGHPPCWHTPQHAGTNRMYGYVLCGLWKPNFTWRSTRHVRSQTKQQLPTCSVLSADAEQDTVGTLGHQHPEKLRLSSTLGIAAWPSHPTSPCNKALGPKEPVCYRSTPTVPLWIDPIADTFSQTISELVA